VRIYRHKLKVDIGMDTKLPFFTKWKYNLLGFTDEDYFVFDLKHHDYHQYISYEERLRLEDVNGPYADLLGQKLLFERVFGQFVHVPPIHGWVQKGRCMDIAAGREISLTERLREVGKLIAKPAHSVGGGTGVHLLSYQDGTFFLNGRAKSESEILADVQKWENYLFVAYIESADYSKKIYSGSANSIRIVSVMKENGEVEFLFAFHRFGCEKSKPVDNISSGGLFALIDLETGIMGEARRKTESQKYASHPDTKEPIQGVQIPRWGELLADLKQAHEHFPFYSFFAWDVVLDSRQIPWVLEINRGSDLTIQMIQPMRSEKLGKFMREKGLLKKW
jgi:hypothetical protein